MQIMGYRFVSKEGPNKLMGRTCTDVYIISLGTDFYKTVLFNSMPAFHGLIRLQTVQMGPNFFVFVSGHKV
jgi:hypothetical protein